VEALRKKEKQDETQGVTTKIDGILSFIPHWMLMYFLARFFFKSHLVYDQTQGSGAVFFLTSQITLIPTQVSQVELYNPKSQIKVRICFLKFGRPKKQMKQRVGRIY
jgi:hypothetical protein